VMFSANQDMNAARKYVQNISAENYLYERI
jgi:hypothetical protein